MQRRWNVTVSDSTDQAVRRFLALNGGGRKGDLSKFIEAAVQAEMSRAAQAGSVSPLTAQGLRKCNRLVEASDEAS